MIIDSKPGFWSIAELVLLILATPLLLFPSFFPALTVGVTFLWLGALAGRKLSRRTPLFSKMPYAWLGYLLTAQILIAILITADPDLTIPKATGLLLGFGWYQLLADAIPDWLSPSRALIILLSAAVGMTLIGVFNVDFPNKIPSLKPIIAVIPQLISLPGTEGGISANQLAGTILLFAPLLAMLVITRGIQRRVRIIALVFFVGATLLLILTQSRSGWLGGIAAIFFILIMLAWVGRFSKKRTNIVLVVSAIAVIGIIYLLSIDQETFVQLWNDPPADTAVGTLGSIAFRQEVWQWSLTSASDFPLTGTGLGTFRVVVRRLYPITISENIDIAHAHNVFLQTWLDIGLLGMIAYVGILFRAARLAWELGSSEKPIWRVIGFGMLTTLIGFHIFGMTDALSFGSKTHLIFWMGLGLLVGVSRLRTPT